MALLARAAAVLAYAGGAHARTKVANLTDGMLHEAVAAWIADQSAAATVYGPIENWDTSKVTNMADVFASRTTFDGDVSKWDTSAVTNMRAAFYGAAAFNQNLSAWDVSQVLDLTFFVNGATAFATPLKWCLPEDANPRFAFYGCACCDDQCGVTQSDTCPGEPTSMPTPFPTVRPTPSPTVSPTEMPTPRPTRFVPPTMPKTKKKKKTNVVVYVIIASAVAGLCLGVCCCALLFRRRGKDYEEHQQRYAPEEDLFATVLRGGSWRKPLPGVLRRSDPGPGPLFPEALPRPSALVRASSLVRTPSLSRSASWRPSMDRVYVSADPVTATEVETDEVTEAVEIKVAGLPAVEAFEVT